SVTDPNQHTTRYTYDAQGNTLSAIDALNRTSTYTYDALNDLTSATDPNGVTTQYSYDAVGDLLSAARPLTQMGQTATTTLTYDPAHPGDAVAITDPNGHTWRYVYDTYGNVVRASDPLNNTVADRYDLIGRKIVEVSPKGNVVGANPINYTTTITYNAFGEATASTDPLGHQTTYQYDPNQNLLAVTDALGHTIRYGYDADNERTSVTRPDGTIDRTAYDGDGSVTAQIDGLGRSTTYAYDPLNRVVAVTDPLTRTTTYGYDAAGNEITVIDPLSRTTSLQYDVVNQLTGVTHSDGTTTNVAYTYTPDGQRATMSDGTGTTTYTYDALERLVRTVNGAGQALGYSYDLANNLTTLTYPDGSQVTRTYDAANRMTAVSDWLGHTTRFAYDADANLVTRTYPNTTTASMSYNAADQLTGIADGRPGSAFWTFAYSRDGLGQLTASVDPIERLQHSYSYDALNRLVGDQRGGGFPAGTTSGSYDAADQLITAADTASTSSAGLSYDAANELTRVHIASGIGGDDLTMGYNADGTRTTEADSASGLRASAGYDQADRLITVTVGTTTSATPTIQAQYAYNGDGLRMSKVVSGTAEAFTWDLGDKMPLLIQDGTTRYITGPDGLPVEQIAADGAVLYYYQDQLGSTRGLLNGSGQIVAAYAYGPYGARIVLSGRVVTPFGYAGQYTDAETGLQYLRTRYYDPTTAQFISRDPAASMTGQPYTYASDNPTNWTDPTGLWTIQICLTASAAWGWQVFAQGCLATANFTSWGVTGSLGAGGGSPSASVTGGAFVSNANHIADLNGPFGYVGASGGEGLVGGVDAFLGSGGCGQLVVGGGPSVGVGANLPVPAEFHGGVSDTWSWVPIGT
ncbi:MAG: type IV secretion protein Rhs, partial [Chloroflexota bacterium]|nr:type IV secretion protein Rhs [Chloroflexota bacterium]